MHEMKQQRQGQQQQGAIRRREFLGRAAGALAGGLIAPAILREGVLAAAGRPGPNDVIQVGFIGAGHRSRLLMRQMPKGGKIIAVTDCYRKRSEEAAAEFGGTWKIYPDYFRLLEAKDIDAVVVPTTDHRRVLVCIHACQAGKDIYAEKPLTLTIREGRTLVKAVRKHGRVFQTGSQQRSMEMNRFACEAVRTGRLGKIKTILGKHYTGVGGNPAPGQPIPEGLDWDLWLGQARYRPFNHSVFGGWMGHADFSGGDITNWGAHGIDQVQWALGMSQSGPVEVWPEGLGLHAPLTMRYANGIKVSYSRQDVHPGGAVFVCEKGRMTVVRNGFSVDPPELIPDPPDPQTAEIWEGPGWQAKYHIGDWLECIQTRKRPVADVEIGHRSVSVCHLGNIARILGRRLRWDPEREVFPGDEEANGYLERPRRKGYELPDPL